MSDTTKPFQPEIKTEIKDKLEEARPIHHADILPKSIKNRHINGFIIETGNIADIEDGTKHQRAFFAEDENKLYIYNETSKAWKSVALS